MKTPNEKRNGCRHTVLCTRGLCYKPQDSCTAGNVGTSPRQCYVHTVGIVLCAVPALTLTRTLPLTSCPLATMGWLWTRVRRLTSHWMCACQGRRGARGGSRSHGKGCSGVALSGINLVQGRGERWQTFQHATSAWKQQGGRTHEGGEGEGEAMGAVCRKQR